MTSPLLSLAAWHKKHLEITGAAMFLPREAAACNFFFPYSIRFYSIFQGLETAEALSLAVSSQSEGRRKKWSHLLTICLFPMSAWRVQSAIDNHAL